MTSRQEEFNFGNDFVNGPTEYKAGPYRAYHYPKTKQAQVYHVSDPHTPIDTINIHVEGGPQAALNKWHAAVRKNVR